MASRRARHAERAAGTVELFGKSSTQKSHAEVLARSPQASRVELFVRPAASKALATSTPKSTVNDVFNKVSETM